VPELRKVKSDRSIRAFGEESRHLVASKRNENLSTGAVRVHPLAVVAPSHQETDFAVDRSTTGLNSGGIGRRSVDGRSVKKTRQDTVDELKHLAKVRVAGSNPVFRSLV
jgi:hypothetical protein